MNKDNSEIRRRGRPSDPNALRFQSVGLRPAEREYLRKWRLNPDDPPAEPGSDQDNLTEQIGLLLNAARRFWPEGNDYRAGWLRDAKGQFRRRTPEDG